MNIKQSWESFNIFIHLTKNKKATYCSCMRSRLGEKSEKDAEMSENGLKMNMLYKEILS